VNRQGRGWHLKPYSMKSLKLDHVRAGKMSLSKEKVGVLRHFVLRHLLTCLSGIVLESNCQKKEGRNTLGNSSVLGMQPFHSSPSNQRVIEPRSETRNHETFLLI